ncbi:hypothetical protein SLEP1_g32799 [Rubroshorea leprosula]|uniref:Uncharacterized protein n=1 Tax=Rubroshorea leprosula TaxID=152421 RepID=A0AAV5KEI7_9ROSI|nr:hypothetical protein SLEP1_g32799 [Rubroshorea leprosula]
MGQNPHPWDPSYGMKILLVIFLFLNHLLILNLLLTDANGVNPSRAHLPAVSQLTSFLSANQLTTGILLIPLYTERSGLGQLQGIHLHVLQLKALLLKESQTFLIYRDKEV